MCDEPCSYASIRLDAYWRRGRLLRERIHRERGSSDHYFWQVSSSYPPGLSFWIPSSGATLQNGSPWQSLTGTPTAAGSFSFSLSLYDYPTGAGNCLAGATPRYTIKIEAVGKLIYNALQEERQALKDLTAKPPRSADAKKKIQAARDATLRARKVAHGAMAEDLSAAQDDEALSLRHPYKDDPKGAEIFLYSAISKLEAALKKA